MVLASAYGLVYSWINTRVVPRMQMDRPVPVRETPAPDSLHQALEAVVQEIRSFSFLFGEFPTLDPNPCEGECMFRGKAEDAWEKFLLPQDVVMALEPVRCPSGEGVRIVLERKGQKATRILCVW